MVMLEAGINAPAEVAAPMVAARDDRHSLESMESGARDQSVARRVRSRPWTRPLLRRPQAGDHRSAGRNERQQAAPRGGSAARRHDARGALLAPPLLCSAASRSIGSGRAIVKGHVEFAERRSSNGSSTWCNVIPRRAEAFRTSRSTCCRVRRRGRRDRSPVDRRSRDPDLHGEALRHAPESWSRWVGRGGSRSRESPEGAPSTVSTSRSSSPRPGAPKRPSSASSTGSTTDGSTAFELLASGWLQRAP